VAAHAAWIPRARACQLAQPAMPDSYGDAPGTPLVRATKETT